MTRRLTAGEARGAYTDLASFLAEDLNTGHRRKSAGTWTSAAHRGMAERIIDRFGAGQRLVAWSESFRGRRPEYRRGEYLVDMVVSREPVRLEPTAYSDEYQGLLLAAESE